MRWVRQSKGSRWFGNNYYIFLFYWNFHVHVNNYCNPIDTQVFLQICDKPFTAVSIVLG